MFRFQPRYFCVDVEILMPCLHKLSTKENNYSSGHNTNEFDL